jgi:hypothetical protein
LDYLTRWLTPFSGKQAFLFMAEKQKARVMVHDSRAFFFFHLQAVQAVFLNYGKRA